MADRDGFLRRLITPKRGAEEEVEAELAFHIRTRIDELTAAGWDEAEAEAEVLRRFGDPRRIGDECKTIAHQRVGRRKREDVVDGMVADLKHTLRGLVRRPFFSAVVIATLALGIGATTAIFSVVDGILLRPLPYQDSDQLVMVWETDRASGTTREPASVPDYFDFRERNRSFSELAAYVPGAMTLTRAGEAPEQLSVAQVTHTLGRVLGITPLRGRFISEEEDAPDAGPVALLAERTWRDRYGADEGILGRTVELDGTAHTVVGILPRVVDFPANPDLWVATRIGPASTLPRTNHRHVVVARLRDDVSIGQAQSDMDRVASELETEYPGANRERGVYLESLRASLFGQVQASLLTLMGAVGLLLAITCVNVANLLLARGARRAKEVAIRSAVGASSRRLTLQFLVEGAVLSAIGGALGILVAVAGKGALLLGLPQGLPRADLVAIDGRILAFVALVATLTAVGFGMIPALQALRGAKGGSLALDSGRSRGLAGHRPRLRSALVVAEVALSVVLVIGAGLLIKSFRTLTSVDPGFRPEQVLKVQYQLPPTRYPMDFTQFPNFPEILDFNRTIRERVAELPGVVSVAVASNHPIEDGFTNSFLIEGREDEFESQAELPMRIVSPGYFATVGVPLLSGRVFGPADGVDSPGVLIINRAAAQRYFPAGDAIGSRIGFWGAGFREIVGIVGNERFKGLDSEAPPAMYPSTYQVPMLGAVRLLVRTAGEPENMLGAVRGVVRELDPALPLFSVETLDQALAASVGRDRFTAQLVTTFAAVSLFLALLGVYGILAYSVAQRTAEIGIRVALGATQQGVARMVVRQGMALVGGGILLGLTGALATSRLLESQLYGVSTVDPQTFGGVALGTAAVALVASFLPATRAARVDPSVALQTE